MNDEERTWYEFLERIATGVDELIIDRANLKVFRERVAPFAEQWKKHIADGKRAEERRIQHWERVKTNPRLQDKSGGPPKKGWEWDGFYLLHVGTGVGPQYEMPARYVPQFINQLKDGQDIACLQKQWDALQATERHTAWVKVPPTPDMKRPHGGRVRMRWHYCFGMKEEDVFGCWRPPLKSVTEDPRSRLMPDKDERKLPRARDKAEEYERYYVWLASIHDNRLPGPESISEGIWPEELAKSVWFRVAEARPYVPGRAFIESALKRVQVELEAKTPKKKGGRKPEHDAEFWKLVQKTYDDLRDKGMDSKGAWNKAADTHGLGSGDAARMQCLRYLRQRRNSEQN